MYLYYIVVRTFPDRQCSAANLVASRTQSTSIPSTCETKGNGGLKAAHTRSNIERRRRLSRAEEQSSSWGVFAVSYMSTKQLDGCSHLQLPGEAPPLPVIVSVLTGRLQQRRPAASAPNLSNKGRHWCLTLIPGMKSPLL